MILDDFDQMTINLVPDALDMKSPLELTQYRIEHWQLVYYDEGLSIYTLNRLTIYSFKITKIVV